MAYSECGVFLTNAKDCETSQIIINLCALLTDDRELFERALIYQDSSAVAYFGDQMQGFTTEGFCGNEYRSNELCAAVMNV